LFFTGFKIFICKVNIMALRLMTGTTCGGSSVITFIADDVVVAANPLNRIYQLDTGVCFTLTASGATTTNDATGYIAYGPYTACTLCLAPLNSGGVISKNCKDCDTGVFTATTFNQAIYTNGQNRAISQNNTVALGGFNGLNN
jgi:hypothetical protein